MRKLEMMQRRAARMVFSDYISTSSVTPMLQQLQWPTLQERRAQAKVYMMYRIVYSLVDIPSSHLTPTLSVRGHNMKFLIPYARTFTYQRSFFPDTVTYIRVTRNSNKIPILNSYNTVVYLTQVNGGNSISFIYTIGFYRCFGIHSVISLLLT